MNLKLHNMLFIRILLLFFYILGLPAQISYVPETRTPNSKAFMGKNQKFESVNTHLMNRDELAEPFIGATGQESCNPNNTFFQNDWDGNDRDNRYVARDWEKYNLGRFATALTDPKNLKSTPPSVEISTFEEGGRLVAAATKRGKVNLIMGGGSGQMLALVKEVQKQGGDLSKLLVIDHSPSNRKNIAGKAGQYPPFGTAWDELNKLVATKTIPNQNYHAYGYLDESGNQNRPKSADVSDLGMLHYACFNEEVPDNPKLFEE